MTVHTHFRGYARVFNGMVVNLRYLCDATGQMTSALREFCAQPSIIKWAMKEYRREQFHRKAERTRRFHSGR